ncbi:imidazole glycerol phosphate synthase subunit HisF [Leptospira perdikensis]|uniref:Imidazole glycerol phosphate synthase subunit HisF n=1 Tax=Leptospira perdikensis TaxID=2484948 RepID=A0A4R9JMH1_9LEPT|nr:HisA/HisF-related TIM barrel protein [Leptospira perdikensis]TGL45837.1 imidazole glycerol phosphate synthase subunit HisF [Leptospira perdikensis]
MLKKRIVAVVILKDGLVVQSIGFEKYLPIGKPEIALEYLTSWGIDEIIILDISATKNQLPPNYEMIRKASKKCYVPLTVGGGITNIDEVTQLMHVGADKVSLNQACLKDLTLISKTAHIFGNQSVVVSVDAILTDDGYRVYDYVERKTTKLLPSEFAKTLSEEGAGEIFINSVDRDGKYSGFDTKLIQSICENVAIPVICCGGAKNANDFVQIFSESKVSAAAAANFFHFTEHSVNITKSIVSKVTDIRVETHADYKESNFDQDLRLLKKEDKILEEMLYLRIEKEVI